MKKYILLPADSYVVINKTILHDEDRKIITSLYLPVIGMDAVMLYFLLWSDLDSSSIVSSDFTHQKIVSNLRMTINEVEDARSKLEAIGLIKTLVKEGNVNNYIYELYSPVSATEFLSHPILSIVLYSNCLAMPYYIYFSGLFNLANLAGMTNLELQASQHLPSCLYGLGLFP